MVDSAETRETIGNSRIQEYLRAEERLIAFSEVDPSRIISVYTFIREAGPTIGDDLGWLAFKKGEIELDIYHSKSIFISSNENDSSRTELSVDEYYARIEKSSGSRLFLIRLPVDDPIKPNDQSLRNVFSVQYANRRGESYFPLYEPHNTELWRGLAKDLQEAIRDLI